MEQLPENMRVLRLYGADKQVLTPLLAGAQKSNKIQIQCMEQGGEMLLLLETATRTGAATLAALNAWQEQIEEKSSGALYGVGEVSLTQAMVSAFVKQALLFACVDVKTSALLEQKLSGIKGLEGVYDFGAHSHAHPKIGRKIAMGSAFAKKYPDQTAQQVAGKIKAAYQLSGADFVLSILPFADSSHLIMVGDKHGFWVRRVPEGENMLLWAVDMLRRAALAVPQAKGSIRIAYGAKLPAFAVAESVADKPADFIAPAQEEFDAPPPPKPAKNAAGSVLFAIALVLLVAVLVLAVLYLYTSGDISSLWYDSGLERFNVSSATLL